MTDMVPTPMPPAKPTGSPALKVGDKVWYVPHHDHELDTDHLGTPLFVFEHMKNYAAGAVAYKKGEIVTNFGMLGKMQGKQGFRRQTDGSYTTRGGHPIRVVGPGEPWPAIIRELFADGTAALDIAHPFGGSLITGHECFDKGKVGYTLHYPDHAVKTTGLRYSTKCEPHTFHLLSDRKGA